MIAKEHVKLAAMYLATSNLGQEEPKNFEDVERAWRRCVEVHAMDGLEVDDELEDWLGQCKRGDEFCAREWGRFLGATGKDNCGAEMGEVPSWRHCSCPMCVARVARTWPNGDEPFLHVPQEWIIED